MKYRAGRNLELVLTSNLFDGVHEDIGNLFDLKSRKDEPLG